MWVNVDKEFKPSLGVVIETVREPFVHINIRELSGEKKVQSVLLDV